jgi:hypothetical protein
VPYLVKPKKYQPPSPAGTVAQAYAVGHALTPYDGMYSRGTLGDVDGRAATTPGVPTASG